MVGIYKITNHKNGKVYVGQSKDIARRKHQHFAALVAGKHENKDMQADYKKDWRSFSFEVIEKTTIRDLNEREKYWIDKLNCSKPNGYNGPWVPFKRKTRK